jgi:hypothetical protein
MDTKCGALDSKYLIATSVQFAVLAKFSSTLQIILHITLKAQPTSETIYISLQQGDTMK